MNGHAPVSRREFINRLTPISCSGEVLELSCERLYIQYVDARAEGRLQEFLQGLEAVLRRSATIKVVQPEWLSREDFRGHVQPLLRAVDARLSG